MKSGTSSDSSLDAMMDGLLAVHERSGTWFEEHAAQPGEIIGRYRVMERIGEGGMGEVFRAEQIEPVRREVALKIVRAGMDTRQFIARFEAERQALARMEHPHIARIYDGGATPNGRPYLAMELVRGEPVTAFCDRAKLGLRARLELFALICRAIEHAHQRGIIHRDIKPSNVLVERLDGTVMPRVIDFGLAKITDDASTELTRPGQALGTPAYTSPEQWQGGTSTVDTRTDVYALGVLLYEVLTGRLPFDPARFTTASLGEICRIIAEEPPPRPSSRVTSLTPDDLDGVSTARALTHRRLITGLKGELDWIVLRAIAKEPDRRYQSAAALADDIGRHLAGEAVAAGPPSLLYRMRKTAGRHRAAVAAALVAVVILTAATIVGFWQARREARERETAESVLSFLNESVFGAHEGVEDSGSMREALARAESGVEEKFASRRQVLATVHCMLGRAWRRLGETRRALPHAVRALNLRRELLGHRHPDTLEALSLRGELEAAGGDAAHAVGLLKEALDARRELSGPSHRQTLDAMSGLAAAFQAAGRHDEAAALLREEMAQRSNSTEAHIAHSRLADCLASQGNLEPAETMLSAALAGMESTRGRNDAETVRVFSRLALLVERRGDGNRAAGLMRDAFDRHTAAGRQTHPATLETMGQLARLNEAFVDFGSAADMHGRCGAVFLQIGDYPRALECFANASRLTQYLAAHEVADAYLAYAWKLRPRNLTAAQASSLPRSAARTWQKQRYQRIEVPMSWDDAKGVCEMLGGHLATATSKEENDFLHETFARGFFCWLGASDAAVEGRWEWVTGEPFAWTNWNPHQPHPEPSGGPLENYLNFGSSNSAWMSPFNELWNDHRTEGDFIARSITYPICEWEPGQTAPAWESQFPPPVTGPVRFGKNGHWYERINQPMPWSDADQLCRKLGGHLATVTSAEENAFLHNVFAYQTACWLGAGYNQKGAWSWITGEPFAWQNWSSAAGALPGKLQTVRDWLGDPGFLRGIKLTATAPDTRAWFGNSPFTGLTNAGLQWTAGTPDGTWAGRLLVCPLCEWDTAPGEAFPGNASR